MTVKKTDMIYLPHSSLSETDSSGDIRPWGWTELHWDRKVDPSPHSILGSRCCRLVTFLNGWPQTRDGYHPRVLFHVDGDWCPGPCFGISRQQVLSYNAALAGYGQ